MMMNEKGQIPHYKITDDILNLVAEIAEKMTGMPVTPAMYDDGCAGSEVHMEKGFPEPTGERVYRKKGTGVFLGEHLLGRAPMPQCLEELMAMLQQWLEQSAAHPLLKAGIVIYQYVMVQFFEGDNTHYGMQHATEIMAGWRGQMRSVSLQEALKPEGLIKAFEQCDLYGEAGPFLLFFLRSIATAMEGIKEVPVARSRMAPQSTEGERVEERVQRLLSRMGDGTYTNRELMELVGLKHRPTFRDKYLLPAMARGLVVMTIPDKPNSSQQRYRKQ